MVARGLRKATRELDIIGRYGGEEFTVILPNTDSVEAMAVAENIRKTIEKRTFISEKYGELKCTISIGVAVLSKHSYKIQDLFKMADNNLYTAKRNGRNRVEID